LNLTSCSGKHGESVGAGRICVRIVKDVGADEAAWRSYVARTPNSTVYHSWAWRAIFEKSFGYRSWLLLAQDETDGNVVGVLPLFLVSSVLSRKLVAVPFRDRGGPLWDSEAALSGLIAEAKRIADRANANSIELKSLQSFPPDLIESHGLLERRYWVHSCVDIRDVGIEQVWNKIGPKTRNMVRQAELDGLVFVDATADGSFLDEWYHLHLVTQKRLGLPPFPFKFFQNMATELCKTGEIAMLVVRRESVPLAATILLLHKNTGIYGYAASETKRQQYRPNDFMLFNSIKWLIAHDYRQFDLGSDSPNQESLLFFKRKWLATQNVIPTYTTGAASHSFSDSSAGYYPAIRKCFSYLPLAMLSRMGGVITKYFG
jgi:hypothetical protein